MYYSQILYGSRKWPKWKLKNEFLSVRKKLRRKEQAKSAKIHLFLAEEVKIWKRIQFKEF